MSDVVAQPRLIADRENDNAQLVSWQPDVRVLTLRPEQRLGARNIWYRFRLENLQPGSQLTLDFIDVDPIPSHINLYLSWDDGLTWSRSSEDKPAYTIKVQGTTLEVSRNLPYPVASLDALVREFRTLPGSGRVESLCTSDFGRDVPIFVFDEAGPTAPVIWFQARSHAFESHSSRAADALVRWLRTPAGAALRQAAHISVIPIIDVDAVALGSAGKDRVPYDMNRDYNHDRYPQVRAIKGRLADLTRTRKVAVFADVHSPWYPDASHWYVIKADEPTFEPFRAAFQDALTQLNAPNDWNDYYSDVIKNNYIKNPEYQMAYLWSREQFPGAVVVNMEIPHHLDHSRRTMTPQGLTCIGAALGHASTAIVQARSGVPS